MKIIRLCLIVLPAMLLTGCLEEEQFPGWVRGAYDGKHDDQPQKVHFHGDRLAWAATIANRNARQNEYIRTQP